MKNKNLNFIDNHRRKIWNHEILDINNFKIKSEYGSLTLRKKNLNNKYLEKRMNDLNNLNPEKIENLLFQLKDNQYSEKKIIINILNKINKLLESYVNFNEENTKNIISFNQLIDNEIVKICNEILEKFFSEDIIKIIINILLFSSLIISYETNKENYNSFQYYFISEDKFLNNYIKILNFYNNDHEIIYNLIHFLGNIINENQMNQKIFFKLGIIDILINYNNNDEPFLLFILNWFFSLLNLEKIYELNISLIQKIQKLFISSLLSGINLKKEQLIELSKYSIKGLINISTLENDLILNQLFQYELISFLIDNDFQNEEIERSIIFFFGNITTLSVEKVEKLINYGIVQKLFNILNSQNKIYEKLKDSVFWVLNNIFAERNLFRKIITESEQINLLINLIKKDICQNDSFYKEILIFFCSLINFSTVDELLQFIKKDQIISIIIDIIKKFIFPLKNNFQKICIISTTIIFKLIYHSNETISDISYKYFENLGIDEICERIIMICFEQNIIDDEEKELISKWEFIKSTIYSNKNH